MDTTVSRSSSRSSTVVLSTPDSITGSKRKRTRAESETPKSRDMDRHARPQLQRASNSVHGDQVIRGRTCILIPMQRSTDDVSEVPNLPDVRRPRPSTTREGTRGRDASTDSSDDKLPYACPYAKHDPRTYSHSRQSTSGDHEYRNCSTGYWTSIARLKQHLYRTHDKTTRCCQRCWQNLPNDDKYRDHIRAATCRRSAEPVEKMDAEQVELVKARTQDNSEAWYHLYSILFPDDGRPASPYAEWVTGENLRQCFRGLQKRLPVLLWQAAIQFQLLTRDEQPTNTKLFRTNAQIIHQALRRCQEEFAESTGLRHVFESGPASPTGSIAGSTSSERGNLPATRIQSNPEIPSHRHERHTAFQPEDTSSSDDEMSIDHTLQSHQTPHHPLAYATPAVSMPYTSASFTATTFAPSYEDLVAMESIYQTYHNHEDTF